MKKVLLVATFGVLPFMSANADQSVVTVHEEPVVVNEPTLEPEVAAPVEEEAYQCPLNGFYASLGIGGSFYKNKLDDGDNGILGVRIKKQSVNRFIGVFALGYGRVFRDVVYFGVEGGLDFSTSKKKDMKGEVFYNDQRIGDLNTNIVVAGVGNCKVGVQSKTSAVSPFLAIRGGYFYRPWETLFYVKAGASHVSTKFIVDAQGTINGRDLKGGEASVSKICPLVALGVQKAFAKKFSARVEAEYRFGLKKSGMKTGDGFNVRAMVAYHINSI
ncbi:MAG: hypothetical protein LBD81_00930 [Holosporaceae bacterium]|nr:hypothetical protein [Holosporaceae bacterium]